MFYHLSKALFAIKATACQIVISVFLLFSIYQSKTVLNMNEFVEKALKPILLQENLSDYNVSVSGSSEKGDGYISNITFAKVIGKTENDQEKVYNFVLKHAKPMQAKAPMPVQELFQNEMNIYSKLFPTFKTFQEEKKIKNYFDGVAKCYGVDVVDDLEVIVLENLKVKGYELHDRKKGMNEAHIKTVLEMYGKYHAVSFALRDQKPDKFAELSKNLLDMSKPKKKPPPKINNEFQQIIDLALKEGNKEIVQACEKLNKNREKFFMNAADLNDPFTLIVHGDCWNNNFLFKYKKGKDSPSTVCLLDFQFSRLGSVVNDLSNFLFTTLSEDTVQQFDEFVDYYYKCLSTSIKNLGSDPNQLFPLEKYLEHWKKNSVWGLFTVPAMVRFCLSESDEILKIAEALESGEGPGEMFSFKVRNEDEYRKRTLSVFKLAIKKGFVDCLN